MSAPDRDLRSRRLYVDLGGVLIALLAAVAIYRGWRPHGGLWLNRADLPDGALVAFATSHPLPDWARYSLPDGLWQYAFGATMAIVWRGERWTLTKTAFVLAPGALGLLVEIGQWAGVAPGTFDSVDLAVSAVAAGVAAACA